MRYNEYNQIIGDAVENYTEGEWPSITYLEGKTVKIEKLSMKHVPDLYELYGPKAVPQSFTYVPIVPFDNYEDYEVFIKGFINSKDPYFFAIVDKVTNKAIGNFALMSIDTKNRRIEVGYVIYSEALKKTRQATEAQFLLMQYVFEDLKYRRYEWKCDHFNKPSSNAALRLGFTFEGTFRNAMVYKNRSRDSDYLSIIDSEWENNKKRIQLWLSDDNFDEKGQQKQPLSKLK